MVGRSKVDKQKTIVILGDFLHEGIATAVTTLGYHLEKKPLYGVKAPTWLKRVKFLTEIRESGQLAGVIAYVPTPLLLYGSQEEFRNAWSQILHELKQVRSIVFAFEDNLGGDFSYWDYETEKRLTLEEVERLLEKIQKSPDFCHDWSSPDYRRVGRLSLAHEQMKNAEARQDEIFDFLDRLFSSGVEIAPFRRRSDVTIRIEEFLEEIDGGLFLRLYIPDARWQADQLASFLRAFERYLRQVEGKDFLVDTRKTAYGTIYLFRGHEDICTISEMENAVSRFDEFMRLCRDQPVEAVKVLETLGIDSQQAQYLISRYVREYQRLLLDTRHDLEHKQLLLRQRLECESLDFTGGEALAKLDSAAPSVILSLAGNNGPVNVTLGDIGVANKSVSQSKVRQVIDGNVDYNQHDERLLELFERFAGRMEAVQLKSDLDQLKDQSASQPAKISAMQRVKSFLYSITRKVGDTAIDVGVKALAKYLEALLGKT